MPTNVVGTVAVDTVVEAVVVDRSTAITTQDCIGAIQRCTNVISKSIPTIFTTFNVLVVLKMMAFGNLPNLP